MIRHETIEGYLRRLASGEPTPGGGATGALTLAEGAGLLSMAARYSDHEDLAQRCIELGDTALGLSDADESGFAAVAESFELPQDSEQQKTERSQRIQQALGRAVEPPRRIVATAAELLDVAEQMLADCNANVHSDVGAALGAVRAGLVAAVVTLETDLSPLKDEDGRRTLRQDIAEADRLTERADELIAHTRRLIRR